MMQQPDEPRRAVVVGGGLAGIATAVMLSEHGWQVDLWEARRQLGGRAASFQDSASQEPVDHCQHVALGCCVCFQDFCQRTNLTQFFRQDRQLVFLSPQGDPVRVGASPWLPAPFHLLPSLFQIAYLSWDERCEILRALWAMARTPSSSIDSSLTMEQWLDQRQASRSSRALFWEVVLVSALSEQLARITFTDARKVFVDGFMSFREGHTLHIPRVALGTMYECHLLTWLAKHHVKCRLGATVKHLLVDGTAVTALESENGQLFRYDGYVLATSWRHTSKLLVNTPLEISEHLRQVSQIESSPISAVHLWFDRPITSRKHAVLTGRLSQWIFQRDTSETHEPPWTKTHYYQVVISASRELQQQSRQEIVDEVHRDLMELFPAARKAKLLRTQVISQRDAVFVAPELTGGSRPTQRTPLNNLVLAGDWTATGWPATMESAVRSGYLAADHLLQSLDKKSRVSIPELPVGWLSRWLIRS